MNVLAVVLVLPLFGAASDAPKIDLSRATVVARGDVAPLAERTAVAVLVEEAEKRTGARWPTATDRPASGAAIVATSKSDGAPDSVRKAAEGLKPEGYVLAVDATDAARPVVWVVGADARGVLFGVGKLLRSMEMSKGSATLDARTHLATSPAYPIRGHQLGYRTQANSYDAWDEAQFDRYIRELALFGSNCVENIPFHDDRKTPVMRVPREVMNAKMSEICQKYDQDYWVWTPADFDLKDSAKRAEAIRKHEDLYRSCARLDGVFFPGGDPGDNPPELVLPFLKDLAPILAKYHPKAKLWLSLQRFSRAQSEYVYKYLDDEQPDWFGGVVCGPSSPPIPMTRRRLNPKYPIRSYPDITHNVRAQYPIPWWDPALAMTLGRESINPRPVQYAQIHNRLAPYTAGFLSYSDGAHDDVNKVVWNLLAWDPSTPVREILIEYARFFLAPVVAEKAADGLLALEQNWHGPLVDNGGVEGTLALWTEIALAQGDRAESNGNWRWQMCFLRAIYDAYTRRRLIRETALEEEALKMLADAPVKGPDAAMDAALAILKRPDADPTSPELRQAIIRLCDDLYKSIGLQTSVPKYHGSGEERGCILDFIDHPLNNRWWLEDEFAAVRKMPSESDKLARLELLRTWEHPGPGSFYDQVGHPGRSPHVVRGDLASAGEGLSRVPIPEVLWWQEGKSRKKPAWMAVMNWPVAMRYANLDPKGTYVIRTTGNGTCLMSINGERVKPTVDNKGVGEFKEFPVPQHLLKDGTLVLTFERPVEHVNWRYASRLAELWVLRK